MSSTSDAAAVVDCRLLIDQPATGAWNMAVDEVLLDTAAERGLATLRFYRWSEATLSLGYFQPYADRSLHRDSGACAIVRRPTGGGAILHDQELTYSLALPSAHPQSRGTNALYCAVHEALGAALRMQGLEVDLYAGDSERLPSPFLCFQRHAVGDVMLAGFKICGSAQRRRRGAILQHGGLLLARSAAARELPGILELAGVHSGGGDLLDAWQRELGARFGFRFVPGTLSLGELKEAELLRAEKYASSSWTTRR